MDGGDVTGNPDFRKVTLDDVFIAMAEEDLKAYKQDGEVAADRALGVAEMRASPPTKEDRDA